MMQIISCEHALKDSEERLFPESRHRSQRVRKKLIKRFGSEFKRVPCIYQIGNKIVAHPVMYEKLKQELASSQRDTYDRMFTSIYSGRNPW